MIFHLARHTFANLAVENGWSVRKIRVALGRASVDTTEKYLRTLRDTELDDDMDELFS